MEKIRSNKLAIIIPAFKPLFLEKTIESIAGQTCKDFTLYIGDDASEFRLDKILEKYYDKISIVYKRFDSNLGKRNLVSHWRRCFEMIRDEEWIWFFSDDDLMDNNCVKFFYEYRELYPNEKLLHFNVEIINENGFKIKKSNDFPHTLSPAGFFSKKIRWDIESFVVEFIFERSLFESKGGFEEFDLAWCADNATWIKLSKDQDICTIPGPRVKWRSSNDNISSITGNKRILLRKLKANIQFIRWVKMFFEKNNLTDYTSGFEKIKWIFIGILSAPSFSFKEKYFLIRRYSKQIEYTNWQLKLLVYFLYYKTKMIFFRKA